VEYRPQHKVLAVDARAACSRPKVQDDVKEFEAEDDTPLLWVLREQLGPDRHQVRLRHRGLRRLHGAHRRRAHPQLRAAGVHRRPDEKIVTIEGLSPDGSHPVQKAWAALDVPQCGYCQSGMVMAAVALLKASRTPPTPTSTTP
jgi:isoquinoline 1-oxidoreductase alpha subunit